MLTCLLIAFWVSHPPLPGALHRVLDLEEGAGLIDTWKSTSKKGMPCAHPFLVDRDMPGVTWGH